MFNDFQQKEYQGQGPDTSVLASQAPVVKTEVYDGQGPYTSVLGSQVAVVKTEVYDDQGQSPVQNSPESTTPWSVETTNVW